jgi:hypothetical protein
VDINLREDLPNEVYFISYELTEDGIKWKVDEIAVMPDNCYFIHRDKELDDLGEVITELYGVDS